MLPNVLCLMATQKTGLQQNEQIHVTPSEAGPVTSAHLKGRYREKPSEDGTCISTRESASLDFPVGSCCYAVPSDPPFQRPSGSASLLRQARRGGDGAMNGCAAAAGA